MIFITTSAAAVVAIFVGVRRHRPHARTAWLLVGASVSLMGAANLIVAASRIPGLESLRWIAGTLFFLAYLPLFIAVFRFGRAARRSDPTVLLDIAIVALASAPVVWQFVVVPNIPSAMSGPDVLLALAIPVVDLLLISMVAPLVLLRSVRSSSSLGFVAGLSLVGIGDSIFAIQSLQASVSMDLLSNVSWLASYVLLGSAALVPSAAFLGTAREPRPGSRDTARLLVMAIALVATPMATLRVALVAPNTEFVALAFWSLGINVLLVVRLHQTVGQYAAIDRRFRRFLSHDRFLAVIKDAAGRYLYMNPSAEASRGVVGDDWYGRTDADLIRDGAHRLESATADLAPGSASDPASDAGDHRTWHTERFAIPGSGGDVGILGLDVTGLGLRAGLHEPARVVEDLDRADDLAAGIADRRRPDANRSPIALLVTQPDLRLAGLAITHRAGQRAKGEAQGVPVLVHVRQEVGVALLPDHVGGAVAGQPLGAVVPVRDRPVTVDVVDPVRDVVDDRLVERVLERGIRAVHFM